MIRIWTCLLITCLLSACATSRQVIDLGETTPEEKADPDFLWPVIDATVTQKFRPTPKGHKRRHQGIDLAGPRNTPIYAVDHGVVTFAGTGYTGYGRLVIVQHLDKSFESYYAHLNKFKVKRGDVVKKGDIVGLMGSTGRSSGVHLHFEIRKDRLALNPLEWLPQVTTISKVASP